ncbi:PREDICTED: uncharacterized protein LOC102770198 [Myotis davidii]|uniref:uncharacterized protein LOC102770198 n=1 Tax=Myotis davidii TaxID=225400 RepID=UPI0007671339|nr:PREDICTED: uncharacterized protein LOC102770198 [Myotis davidii]
MLRDDLVICNGITTTWPRAPPLHPPVTKPRSALLRATCRRWSPLRRSAPPRVQAPSVAPWTAAGTSSITQRALHRRPVLAPLPERVPNSPEMLSLFALNVPDLPRAATLPRLVSSFPQKWRSPLPSSIYLPKVRIRGAIASLPLQGTQSLTRGRLPSCASVSYSPALEQGVHSARHCSQFPGWSWQYSSQTNDPFSTYPGGHRKAKITSGP